VVEQLELHENIRGAGTDIITYSDGGIAGGGAVNSSAPCVGISLQMQT